MTIDCNVPIELDVEAMKAGAPDIEALRALFTELEFTSLLKELLPVVEVSEALLQRSQVCRGSRSRAKIVSEADVLAVAIEASAVRST